MSLDHIGLRTFDFHRTVAFYEAILATLGYTKLMTIEGDRAVGFGSRFPSFWIGNGDTSSDGKTRVGAHVAFVAKSRRDVDAFYQAALKHGATDNGPPGFRPQYHRFYYGAFVVDHEGNNIEAVNHFDWRALVGWKTILSTSLAIFIGIGMLKYF